MRATTRQNPVPAHRGRHVRALVGVLLVTLVAGCGVRIDSPAPSEPSPDAHEILRSTVVADALTVQQLASTAAETVSDDALSAALTQTADFAGAHAEQLGGPYDSGLPDAPQTPAATTSTQATGVGVDDVVDALAGASVRARGAADTTDDGPLARLFASVSTSEILSAERLGRAADVDLPDSVVPVEAALPETLPAGVAAAALTTLVEAEDAAGYVYEVQAARTDDAVRTRSADRGVEHRVRAAGWARLLDIDGTDQDPRAVAYEIPAADDARARGVLLEDNLTASYASLVGSARASNRTELVDLLADTARAQVAWGAPVSAFPGLPEQN